MTIDNESDLHAFQDKLHAGLKAAGMDEAAAVDFLSKYDDLIVDMRENEVADEAPGVEEIDVLHTCALALNSIAHDHLRRRVHKALGVLMLEPQPDRLERIVTAIGEGLQQAAPMLAQMAAQGAPAPATDEPVDGSIRRDPNAPSGFSIRSKGHDYDANQWISLLQAFMSSQEAPVTP